MKKFFLSVGFATKGIVQAFKSERNIRVQFVVGLLVVVAGFYFEISNAEWIALMLTTGIVISLELVNSAIESLVDLVTKEHHPIAGRVKDIAAGSVLFFSVIALITGILIFKKYILL
jgi:diacylglycerol kinase